MGTPMSVAIRGAISAWLISTGIEFCFRPAPQAMKGVSVSSLLPAPWEPQSVMP